MVCRCHFCEFVRNAYSAWLTGAPPSSSEEVSQANMTLLEQLLTWPDDKVFPAIDLCKLLLLRSGMQAHAPALVSQVLDVAEKMVRARFDTHTNKGRSISTCTRVVPVWTSTARYYLGLLVRTWDSRLLIGLLGEGHQVAERKLCDRGKSSIC